MTEMDGEKIKQNKGLNKLYGKLAQILDGLWFLETEKRLGFEKAYEIDEAVWSVFGRKEADRILKFLGLKKGKVMISDLPKILQLSLFNQSIKYEFNTPEREKGSDGNFRIFRFRVIDCKTYKGMEKVKRPPLQIRRICEGIGLVFYKNMLDELFPGSIVSCISCPYHDNDSTKDPTQICTWEFRIPVKYET